jgi:tRNA1Val (adenine37-N6)-methyltransferase
VPDRGETVDDLWGGGRVIQARQGYRFSLDAVLLASFAGVRAGDMVADLGAGCGVVSILLARREPACRIVALEIQPAMCDRARRSVLLNGLQQRVTVVEGDVRRASALLGAGRFDLLVSNPPYWPAGSGKLPRAPELALARHELALTLGDLLAQAALLLRPGGRLALVHRAARLPEIVRLAHALGLSLARVRMVAPRPGAPPNLVLVEAKRGPAATEELPLLVVYGEEGRYSDELLECYLLPEPGPGG